MEQEELLWGGGTYSISAGARLPWVNPAEGDKWSSQVLT